MAIILLLGLLGKNAVHHRSLTKYEEVMCTCIKMLLFLIAGGFSGVSDPSEII